MDFKGKFKDFTKSWDGTGILSFTVLNVSTDYLQEIVGKDLRINVKQWRERRSLTANSYYWVLVGQIADALKISKPYCHNLMMRRYGQVEMFGDQIAYTMLPDNEDTQKRMDEMEEAHFAPTSMTKYGKDGVTYRAWKLLVPSHRMDTKHMSILIDGVVSEAHQLGISTMTPDELDRLVKMWSP